MPVKKNVKMSNNEKYVFDSTKGTKYTFPTHKADLVMDRSEAITSEVFAVTIEPGKAPPLHIHDDTEQIFYITEGKGTLKIGEKCTEYDVCPGQIVRIPPDTYHLIECTSGEPLKYIAIDCFLGGRPKDEPTWDSHIKNVCKGFGWDIDSTRTL